MVSVRRPNNSSVDMVFGVMYLARVAAVVPKNRDTARNKVVSQGSLGILTTRGSSFIGGPLWSGWEGTIFTMAGITVKVNQEARRLGKEKTPVVDTRGVGWGSAVSQQAGEPVPEALQERRLRRFLHDIDQLLRVKVLRDGGAYSTHVRAARLHEASLA